MSALFSAISHATSGEVLAWRQLPALPDPQGWGGPFAGVAGGVLVVAGGANFPKGLPWEGGAKAWYDRIYTLESPQGRWQPCATRLPRPLAYGISLNWREGMICLGGSDAAGHYAEAWLIKTLDGKLVLAPLPSLPAPLANSCGAILGERLYVAGGLAQPTNTSTLKLFWRLDLSRPRREWAWEELEPWPGPPRMLAVAGAQDGSFFLFSGTDLEADAAGKARRVYLKDAYRFTPGKGWRAIAPLPRPVVGAPGPAAALGQTHLAIFGGDDGSRAHLPPNPNHPGFLTDVLLYHTLTDTWALAGHTPAPRVTTPLVPWQGGFVVPSGEVRPGLRSPQADLAQPVRRQAAFGGLNYTALIAYLAGVVGLGCYFTKRTQSTNDFFRGGQRIPWWAAGLSIYATVLSSITYMAIPAKAYASDWSYAFNHLTIVVLAPVVIAFYLPFFRQLDVTSAYEYLEKRFNLAVRWFGSVCFMVYQLGRCAIVLYLPALALSTVSSLDLYACIVVMGVLCVLYTVLGGMEAVVWTDVVQTLVLLGGVGCALGVVVSQTDHGVLDMVQLASRQGKFFEDVTWRFDPTSATAAVIFFGCLFTNLTPYTASQDVVQRYVTTKDTRLAARAIWTNALMTFPSVLLFFGLGTALFVFYQAHPERLDPNLKMTDAIFPLFIMNEMPAGLGGLVVAGLFAAAQSTLSGSLNSVAACWVTDFHRRRKPGASDRENLRLARWITVLVGLAATLGACLLSTFDIGSLWDIFLSLLGLTGATLAGLFALGIFTRRANGTGALCGALVSVAVLYFVQQYTRVHFFLYGAIGILVCFGVGWLASWFLGRPVADLTGLTVHTPRRESATAQLTARL
jgi:SSS family transporter